MSKTQEEYTKTHNSYNAFAKQYSQLWPDTWKGRDFSSIKLFLDKVPPKGNILELGGGDGGASQFFNSVGFETTYTDSSEAMVSLAKEKLPKELVHILQLPTITFPDESFDGIFSRYVLQHLSNTDLKKSLQEMLRVLKRNGFIYLSFHISQTDQQQDYWYKLDSKTEVYMNLLPTNTVKQLMENVGCSILFEKVFDVPEEPENDYIVILKKIR